MPLLLGFFITRKKQTNWNASIDTGCACSHGILPCGKVALLFFKTMQILANTYNPQSLQWRGTDIKSFSIYRCFSCTQHRVAGVSLSGASLSEGHVVPHSSRPHSLNTNTDELPVSLMCVSLDRGKKHEPTQTHGEREDSTQRGLRPRNHTCNLC